MTFSVVVITYNQDIEKTILTLKSILLQDYTDYEIIISDDGSKNNYFGEIDIFLKNKSFNNYKLFPHEKNQGTVKNILSALSYCTGKYIKIFGSGDLFYNSNSLKDMLDVFEKTDCDICFGLMRGYYFDNNKEIHYTDFCRPFDIKSYKRKKNNSGKYKNRIMKNLIMYGDHVFGAVTCYKHDIFKQYLLLIQDKVTYVEDIFQVLSFLDGKEIEYYDKYAVWYEMYSGISFSKKKHHVKSMRKDFDNFYEMIYKMFPDNKYLLKRKRLSFLYIIDGLYLRTLVRCFFNPDAIRFVIAHIIQRELGYYKPETVYHGFLEDKNFVSTIK